MSEKVDVKPCFYLWPNTTYECEVKKNKKYKNQRGPDVQIHNSSTVCVYFIVIFCKAVSTVDVAVVLPVEGGIDRAVPFFF